MSVVSPIFDNPVMFFLNWALLSLVVLLGGLVVNAPIQLPLTPSWVLVVIIFSFCPFLLTYLYTSLRFWLVLYWHRHGRHDVEPPAVPYWIPFVGNTFSLAADMPGYISYIS